MVGALLLCGCENAAQPPQVVPTQTAQDVSSRLEDVSDGLHACADPNLKPVETTPGVGTLTGGYPAPPGDSGIRLARPFPLVDPRSPLPVVTIPHAPFRPSEPTATDDGERSAEQGPMLRAPDEDTVAPLPPVEPLPPIELPEGISPSAAEDSARDARDPEPPLASGTVRPAAPVVAPPSAPIAESGAPRMPSVVKRQPTGPASGPAMPRGTGGTAREQLLQAARGQTTHSQPAGASAKTPAAAGPARARMAVAAPRSAAMQAVTHRAEQAIQRGYDLAGRGALYSARAEFIQALRTIAQALDLRVGDRRHSAALAAGLKALEEAEDFVPPSTSLESDIDVTVLIRAHDTPVCKELRDEQLLPVVVLRHYYTYAQEKFVVAGGGEEAASMALFGLGKTFGALADQQITNVVAAEPKAMVFHQAALTTYPGNFLAANELAVLTARFGEYATARALLQYSVSLSPHSAVWRNLALVHDRLGEQRLSQLARREAELALARETSARPGNREGIIPASDVEWVDPATFATSGQALADLQSPVAADPSKSSSSAAKRVKPAANKANNQPRSASWWKWWAR